MLEKNPFVDIKLPALDAMSDTPEKIISFGELPAGWHYGNGGPIDDAVIDIALDLYWHLALNHFTHTDAFPGADGEIQLTAYHTASDGTRYYIGIIIEPTGQLSLVYEINGRDGREPIDAADIDAIKTAVREIAGDIAGRRWSTSDIFTQKTLTTSAVASQRSPSRNQAWMVVHPLSNELVWMPSATVIASTRERIIDQ
jgi:hypothetical protein